MNVEFRRTLCKTKCNSCQQTIEESAPTFFIIVNEDMGLIICEDCGNALQIELNEEYIKFVDMGK